METDTDTVRLLYKVASAYYDDHLTYEEIGKLYGFSRMTVARLLEKAKEEKIVQILVNPVVDRTIELERKLEAKYEFHEFVIVHPSGYDPAAISQALGPAAASYLLSRLTGKETICMSWGNTILSVVNSLTPRNWPGIIVVPTTGGLGKIEAETYGADLVRRTAQLFKAKPFLIPSPGIVRNKSACEALLSDPQIVSALSLAANADLCLVGIGGPIVGSFLLQSGIISEQELEELHECGAVGDIALRFIDQDGRTISHEIDDRIIGLTLNQITNIPRVIGVAGGEEKRISIRAALRGNLVRVMVTDDRTAEFLLNEE